MRNSTLRSAGLLMLAPIALFSHTASGGSECEPGWDTTFGGVIGTVRASAAHNDGTGEAFYVVGSFHQAGYRQYPDGWLGVRAWSVARWKNNDWEALPEELAKTCGRVYADLFDVIEFDGDLYVAGAFMQTAIYVPAESNCNPPVVFRNIARWDGAHWNPLGAGIGISQNPVYGNGAGVRALHVHDDGSGPALYAAGFFDSLNTDEFGPVRAIGRWDGEEWTAVGVPTGGDPDVLDMATYDDDGNGVNPPYLYIVGSFNFFSSAAAANIARWNGTTWSAIPGAPNGTYKCAVSYDPDGSGPIKSVLVVGGTFVAQPECQEVPLAVWDGTAWSYPVAPACQQPFPASVNPVTALTVVEENGQNVLYFGGRIGSIDGTIGLRRYDGQTVTAVGDGAVPPISGNVYDLNAFPFAADPTLYVGGTFANHANENDINPSIRNSVLRRICEGAPACPADFNGDSTRDVADLFAYINAWLAKTPNADFNDDNAVDVADLFAYINAWLAGC